MTTKESLASFGSVKALCRDDEIIVLDGGFATHIEDVLHVDISSSPLWSASLLRTDDGREKIVQTHVDFLEAGAQIISTSTYQASLLAFEQAGIGAQEAHSLIVLSVELAHEARSRFLAAHESSRRAAAKRLETPLVCLSLGPFGAALANGAEYTGQYYVPGRHGSKQEPSLQDLESFHFDRLSVLAASPAWEHVDVIAVETIPRLDEAIAARDAIARLYESTRCTRKPAFVSFVFPNGRHLPFPAPSEDQRAVDTSMDELIDQVLRTPVNGTRSFDGIGINCTKPIYLDDLVQRLSKAVKNVWNDETRKPSLFLYPDGGLVWNGIERKWKEASDGSASEGSRTSWSDAVLQSAKAALASSAWARCFVGGCCKATAGDISMLRNATDKEETQA